MPKYIVKEHIEVKTELYDGERGDFTFKPSPYFIPSGTVIELEEINGN